MEDSGHECRAERLALLFVAMIVALRALRVAGTMIGLALALIGLGGLGDDLTQWQQWLASLEPYGGVRLVFPASGVLLIALAVAPTISSAILGRVTIADASIPGRSDRGERPMWRLSVTNHGRADRLRVKVEQLFGTGGSESGYHLPWRLHPQDVYAPLAQGESEVVNVAQPSQDMNTFVRATLTDRFPLDMFSTTAPVFQRSAPVGALQIEIAVYGERDQRARARRRFVIDLDERDQPCMKPIQAARNRLLPMLPSVTAPLTH